MFITTEFRSALLKAAQIAGSNTELGKAIGVSCGQIGKWFGEGKHAAHEIKGKNEIRILAYFKMHGIDFQYPSANNIGPDPCTGKPDTLRNLCRHWYELTKEQQIMITALADAALKKHTRNESSTVFSDNNEKTA